jgi:thiosulfate/3-mercaptopyruvate sulfurtransferase
MLVVLAACGGGDGRGDTEAESSAIPAESAAPAPAAQLLVDAAGLSGELEDSAVVVLHVAADRAAYDEGHIPGARFLPLRAIAREVDGNPNELPPVEQLDSVFESLGVSDDTRVVLYGDPLPAARAFFTLDYLGHGGQTALLDGALPAWREAGLPLSTEADTAGRGSFTPRVQPERSVDAEWVNQHRTQGGVALVDARPTAQYTGEEAGDGVERPGHIPGAGSLFWEETIASSTRPELHDSEALHRLLREAGVSPGDTVVTYCRTGMQASFMYFVARLLGYETRMYDPSYLDWSRRSELPVETGAPATP